ncbi:MAG: hypothetical protein M5R36_01840 [Deltaproteobacteria bacterium]|nr:hypothetical protein [Deltaproteobacteria bacterium]
MWLHATVKCSNDNENAARDDDTDDGNYHIDDDTLDNLPVCDPYFEPQSWITWIELDDMLGEFYDERGDDSTLLATVHRNGNGFTIEKGSFVVEGTWNRTDRDISLEDMQTVRVHFTQTAGDDGCCDGEGLFVWDGDRNLLLYFAWNIPLYPIGFDDPEMIFDAMSEWEKICRYEAGERPNDYLNWVDVYGLKLTGYCEKSSFALPKPGESAFSDDGLFEVHWPIAYEGDMIWHGDRWYSRWTIFELVAAAP